MTEPQASADVVVTFDAAVTTIRLNRPEKMNGLTTAVKTRLRDSLLVAADDTAVRAVVITGTGRAFCAGQDLAEFAAHPSGDEVAATIADYYNPIVRAITSMPKPVIAALNGTAAGAGLSIALACDLRIAATSAKLTTAFADVGLACDTGISWTLPRIVGRARALDLLLRPRAVDSEEALRLGLVNAVVPDAEFAGEVARLAAELAAGPTLALGAIKAAVNHSEFSSLDDALAFEAGGMVRTAASLDHRVALQAFPEKRRPTFTGA
ncbi:enoyl-CoA hydratase [Rathayibacter soli]|uniref:enoyl-CoA hydratase n=1 Tax=Rathayibacter soli TaxID=3144168 RepID=UPI0027E4DF57|nr:enoyl-CoA hydratase [Glaciibacter superstes]